MPFSTVTNPVETAPYNGIAEASGSDNEALRPKKELFLFGILSVNIGR